MFCLEHTYTPEKFSSRPQETKQQIYIPVFRVALLLIFFGRLGKKTETETERKSNIPSQLGKSIDLPWF